MSQQNNIVEYLLYELEDFASGKTKIPEPNPQITTLGIFDIKFGYEDIPETQEEKLTNTKNLNSFLKNINTIYPNLNQITISYINLTKETINMINQIPNLNTLILIGNELNDSGAIMLADELKSNASIQNLSLRANNIGDDGIKAINNLITNNPVIKELNLRNKMSNE